MKHTTTITGPMMAKGMRRIEAKSGMVVRTTSTATMLPRYMLAIRPQTKSGRSMNSMGPGLRPQIISPPIITAAVAEPGTPSASIGRMALLPAAWSAVSGATTPSGSPWPKWSLRRERRLANAVAHEGRRRRSAGRDAHPAPDDAAAQEGDPVAGHGGDRLGGRRAALTRALTPSKRKPLLHGEHELADAEQADDRDEEADAGEKLVEAIGQAQTARNGIHANSREGKAKAHGDDGLEWRRGAKADEAGEGQEVDGEIFRRAEPECEVRDPARQNRDQDHPDQRAEAGRQERERQRLRGLSLLAPSDSRRKSSRPMTARRGC